MRVADDNRQIQAAHGDGIAIHGLVREIRSPSVAFRRQAKANSDRSGVVTGNGPTHARGLDRFPLNG